MKSGSMAIISIIFARYLASMVSDVDVRDSQLDQRLTIKFIACGAIIILTVLFTDVSDICLLSSRFICLLSLRFIDIFWVSFHLLIAKKGGQYDQCSTGSSGSKCIRCS